jgi:hypothetical protein
MTTATAAKKTTAATVKPNAKKPTTKAAVTVTPRRLARDFGAGKKGHTVLILDPKVFGSAGDNWLNGRSYATRQEAEAAAKAAGAKLAS